MFDGFPEPGSTLVHNTFTGAYVVLSDNQLSILRRADRGEDLTCDELPIWEDADLRDPDVGLIVESRSAEEADFRAWFQRRRARTTALDVTVGINLACNFKCTYCSQEGVLDGTTMSLETCEATAHWIAERAVQVGVEAVKLNFVGGEPLLHPERVKAIAGRVRELVSPHGLTLSFALITNGYFLSPELVAEMIPLGLVKAQVTLDGDETTHSKTRISKKGEDTFQRIFDNVIAASRHIRVYVRGNYETATVHGFAPLVRKLAAAGLPDGSQMSFQPALAGLSSSLDAGSGSCTWSGSDTSLHVALHDEILRNGFEPPALSTVGPCEFHDHHAFAIEPTGTIYKCPGFLGHPEWGIGHVSEGLSRRYQQMIAVNPQRECGSCAHRPNCAGGCASPPSGSTLDAWRVSRARRPTSIASRMRRSCAATCARASETGRLPWRSSPRRAEASPAVRFPRLRQCPAAGDRRRFVYWPPDSTTGATHVERQDFHSRPEA